MICCLVVAALAGEDVEKAKNVKEAESHVRQVRSAHYGHPPPPPYTTNELRITYSARPAPYSPPAYPRPSPPAYGRSMPAYAPVSYAHPPAYGRPRSYSRHPPAYSPPAYPPPTYAHPPRYAPVRAYMPHPTTTTTLMHSAPAMPPIKVTIPMPVKTPSHGYGK